MSTDDSVLEELKPLAIRCTSADCDNDLHCFLQTKKWARANLFTPGGLGGQCRYCGVDLVDWARVHKRDFSDSAYTFTVLKKELIRHHFWHTDIDQRAINYARRKGKVGIKAAAEKRIIDSVGAANPFHDGWQTPKLGNPIYYAQHATATCCRKCIEEWHGIPRGRDLTRTEVQYLTDLVFFYIDDRLPYLTDNGEKVPRIRSTADTSVSVERRSK
jgi:hypothetical protein